VAVVKTVFVTGADRGLGAGIAKLLLERGHRVFAGQFMPEWKELEELKARYPKALSIIPLDVGSDASVKAAAGLTAELSGGKLDALINNAGVGHEFRLLREGLDYAAMLNTYSVNALGCIRTTEAFLPLLDKGEGKRLCYVSSEAGSIGRSRRDSGYGYCMSKSALNMGVSILFNTLRRDGYTFRVYYPGWIKSYMMGRKGTLGDMEPEEAAIPAVAYCLSENGAFDEDRLAMRSYAQREWPW
jgi:NAD(P)-dependent dehydrogenase (short-subunit alcohol dehydrogenase family)